MNEADRRPIAARDWSFSQRVAADLARRGCSPNGISVAGAVFGIVGGLALAATSLPAVAEHSLVVRALFLVGAVMMQLRLQCNLYDGMVAIATGKASPVGELYNDVPDRISDSAFFIGAGYALGGDVVFGYAAALAAMFTAYVRALGKAGGAPQEFCGPMAKPHRMALLTLVAVYVALAPQAWQPAFGPGGRYGLIAIALGLITVGGFWTVARRLQRITANLRGGRA